MNPIDREQKIVLLDRKKLSITEVVDVDSFNLDEIVLKTFRGKMNIKGSNLHVKRLSLEVGEIEVEGEISGMVFCDKKIEEKKGFLKSLFR